ncbi:MAG: hypothetical protein AAFP04_14195 [Myxococcota bacterium]
MNVVQVKRELTLSGSDEKSLDTRIHEFCEAVRSRQGSVIDVRWSDDRSYPRDVSILYRVPIANAGWRPALGSESAADSRSRLE